MCGECDESEPTRGGERRRGPFEYERDERRPDDLCYGLGNVVFAHIDGKSANVKGFVVAVFLGVFEHLCDYGCAPRRGICGVRPGIEGAWE